MVCERKFRFFFSFKEINFSLSLYTFCSFNNESYGKSNRHGSGDKRFKTTTVGRNRIFFYQKIFLLQIINDFNFRHQIRTYTQQLVKDTDGILKDLVNNNNDRHLKIQRERLVDEFTTALTSFQVKRKFHLDWVW